MAKNILFGIFLFALTSCSFSSDKKITEFHGKTMGTTYSVKVYSSDSKKALDLQKDVDQVLVKVNQQMSTYKPQSEISRINQSFEKKTYKLSPWFGEVLDFSLKLADKTEGAFDPTIGPLVNLWGFGPSGERKKPSQQEIDKIKDYVGYKKLNLVKKGEEWLLHKLNPKVYIDLSASAKGYGVDKVSQLLTDRGFHNHLVEIGGEIRVQGSKGKEPWKVAIEEPNETLRAVQKVLQIENLSLATSGNYRNFFKENGKRYGHTIDHLTGEPVEGRLLSVSVVGKSCMYADGWATALMSMGAQKAFSYAQKLGIAAYLVTLKDDGKTLEVLSSDKFTEYTN